MSTVSTSTNADATRNTNQHKVLIAADGTACAIYHNGTDLVFRAAVSPYTSWSSAVTISSGGNAEADAIIDGSDVIDVLYKTASHTTLAQVRLTKSGSTWTVGTQHDVYGSSSDFGGSGEPLFILRDAGSRLWAIYYRYTGSADSWEAKYSTDNGSTWNASLSGGTLAFATGFNSNYTAIHTGNYVVFIRADGSGNICWRRVDTTGTLTTWTTEQTTAQSIFNDHAITCAVDGSGIGVLAASPKPSGTDYAIRTVRYDPTGDAWGSQTDIGTGTSDRFPATFLLGSNLYVVWAEFAASNSYAVVYKIWNGSTFSSKTTVVASGSNRVDLSLGAGNSTLGALWTEGTSTPWNVVWATVVAGGAPPDRLSPVVVNVPPQSIAYLEL